MAAAPSRVRGFDIRVSDGDLADLRARIERSRLPLDWEARGWRLGASSDYLRELVDYWVAKYDWRRREAELNALPQFLLTVEGVHIHFLWYRSGAPNSVPVVLTHGWPGTFYEFNRLAPMLAGWDPSAPGLPMDVVVPALPGFPFSSMPKRRPAGYVADLWVGLMDTLGYPRFIAHGGDLGAGVSEAIARRHGDRLLGLHLTAAWRAISKLDPDLDDEGRAFLAESEAWDREEWAYGRIQGTKPATAAVALTDSPIGLAAWLVEKYRSWGDCGGDVESRFSKDYLLTTVCLYWFANSVFRSFIPYADARRPPTSDEPPSFVSVPTGMLRLPGDIPSMPPPSAVSRRFNVVRYTSAPEGGHFPAIEVPDLLAGDLRSFASEVASIGLPQPH